MIIWSRTTKEHNQRLKKTFQTQKIMCDIKFSRNRIELDDLRNEAITANPKPINKKIYYMYIVL